jgi:Asp-tRNA(Asn)/Glu-tRNA(Gln) amidotransferase A subunit family amidase
VFPPSDSMDHVGPPTKDGRDTALMMNVIAG